MKIRLIRKVLNLVVIIALLALLTGSFLVLSPAQPARADTITVLNVSDSGAGSLRQAIIDAAAGDTIVFTGTLSGQTIRLTSELSISKNLIIDGSSLAFPVAISGDTNSTGAADSGDTRIFNVSSGITFTLYSVIITKGYSDGTEGGGAAYNQGTMYVYNSTFSDHVSTSGDGAGISGGTVMVVDSTFVNNINEGEDAGAIQANVTILNSTFIGNRANTGSGGAIRTGNGTSLIVNSTFSENYGESGGGAIQANGTVTIVNSTFYANSSLFGVSGSAIQNTAILTNTIIYGVGSVNCSVAQTNGGNNIDSGTSCGFGSNNGSMSSTDPMLAARADNGGATQTHALLPGSPAINAGNIATCAAPPVNNLDQRGVTRPQGSACDIGAFEAFLPEMDVQGNGTSIPNGDTTPSTADDTGFGGIIVDDTPITHTFTISNAGDANLNLTGLPAITLTYGIAFTVTQPASATLEPGETTTFTITFDPPGGGNFTDTVNIANNDFDENPYTFVVSGTGQTLPVNLSISANNGSETAQTEITATATTTANVLSNQIVSLGVSGTGITSGDYILSSSTITILNGQNSGTVTFTVQNDTLAEGDETATLTISNPSAGLTLGITTSQNVTITDNDGQYTIAADLTSVTEGDTGSTPITFTVTRSGAYTTTNGTVSFALGGTASNGSDYNNVAPTSPITFITSEISKTITMDVLGDYVDEDVETISATLSSPTVSGGGTASIGTATAQISITDNDDAGVTVNPTSGMVTNESGLTATFTVRLNTAPTGNVVINAVSSNNAEGMISPSQLTFTNLDWSQVQTVTVTGVDDNDLDGDVSYTIQLTVDGSTAATEYIGVDPDDVAVVNLDNEIPIFLPIVLKNH